MEDSVVKQLLESLTKEQKQQLIKSLEENVQAEKNISYKRNPPKEKSDAGVFVMNNKPKVAKTPVNQNQRFNSFTDDGSEHKDQYNQTPRTPLTERRRPSFKPVEQTCNRCNKTVQVHPQYVRDFFVCDSCLRK
jgi:hypothetical protein